MRGNAAESKWLLCRVELSDCLGDSWVDSTIRTCGSYLLLSLLYFTFESPVRKIFSRAESARNEKSIEIFDLELSEISYFSTGDSSAFLENVSIFFVWGSCTMVNRVQLWLVWSKAGDLK